METTWNKETIQSLLVRSNKAVERAMVVLYNRQTVDEQQAEVSAEENSRGFSGYDAKSGSYYAKWVISGKNLSGKFLEKARKMSMKYWKQLAEEANSKNNLDAKVEAVKRIFQGAEEIGLGDYEEKENQ